MGYMFYTDPGHGWLAVKIAELHRLGIIDKISNCSYMRGKTAYLEEDCDAPAFLNAKEAAGEEVKINHSNSARDYSPIRSYAMYSTFAAHAIAKSS